MSQELLRNLALAAGLGFSVAVLLWLLRGYALMRRVRLSAFFGAIAFGLYLILSGAGWPGTHTGLRVLLGLSLLLGANTLIQFFDAVVWDYALGQRRHIHVPRLLIDVFNFVALAATALAVLNGLFGVELSALLVTSTVASAVIGLALQDLLVSIVAGLALQLEQPFRVGDWVVVSGQEGEVMQMNWRTLTLRTRDQHHVIVPNANVAKQDILNYSRPTSLQRQHLSIGLAYQHPPGAAQEVIARVLAASAGVRADPAPSVVVREYGDFAIEYDARYWIDDFERAEDIRANALTRLWYELRRAGLTIPFPTQDITVRTLPEDHAARASDKQRREVFAELRQLALFAPLTDAQIEQVVRGAVLHRYAESEALVRQGDPGDSLFVIKSGRVRVDVRADAGQVNTVDTLGPDDFFGEMSLLTGEPRSASVIAITETEVIVVDKADLREVLTADTHLLEAISLKLEARTRSTAEALASGSGPLLKKQSPQQVALVQRIRGFFGIKPN